LLTLQKLKDMIPGAEIASGIGSYPQIVKGEIKWIAVRGLGYHDWTIYYNRPTMTLDYIRRHGDKVFGEKIIRQMVDCDDEAFGMYRF